MTGPQKTLLAIALFVALALGGFLWFVTQWGKTHSTKADAGLFILAEILWGELAAGQGGQGPLPPLPAGAPT